MEKIRFKDYLIDYLEQNRLSNKEFANRINITPKHLGAILKGTSDLSFTVIADISKVTNIPMATIVNIESNYKTDEELEKYLQKEQITISEYINKFNYKFLNNHYLEYTDCVDKYEIAKDILKYLRVTTPSKVYELDENIKYKSKNQKKELLALWLERCHRKSLEQNVLDYKKENICILVKYIQTQAKSLIFDEKKLIDEFNKNGIILVIEDEIPTSKIRGAFLVERTKPAIYLTRRHKRIADIYFALLHELGHCWTDYNMAKEKTFVSVDLEAELETDKKALNWMVDNNYYKDVCLQQNYKIEDEINYPKAFIAYRLAFDKKLKYSSNCYQKYNVLLKDIV